MKQGVADYIYVSLKCTYEIQCKETRAMNVIRKFFCSIFQVVRSVEDAEKNTKAVDNWIDSISDLHRQKPPQNVHYSKAMPDIESLMQEWPPEFEEMLKSVRCLQFLSSYSFQF